MRTVLDYVKKSGKNVSSNITEEEMPGIELVTKQELMNNSFEDILRKRFEPFIGKDYKQISSELGVNIKSEDKSKYANIVKQILLKGLKNENDADEIKKSGIKIKTIRLQKNGSVKELLSF